MSEKCEHKFKPYATINYIIPVELYDDGYYGWFFQDKIYQCENCYLEKVVTRACKIEKARDNEMTSGIEGKFERIPLWYEMVEGQFADTKCGSFYKILKNRELDNPEYPKINMQDLILNGKTVICEKILE